MIAGSLNTATDINISFINSLNGILIFNAYRPLTVICMVYICLLSFFCIIVCNVLLSQIQANFYTLTDDPIAINEFTLLYCEHYNIHDL